MQQRSASSKRKQWADRGAATSKVQKVESDDDDDSIAPRCTWTPHEPPSKWSTSNLHAYLGEPDVVPLEIVRTGNIVERQRDGLGADFVACIFRHPTGVEVEVYLSAIVLMTLYRPVYLKLFGHCMG